MFSLSQLGKVWWPVTLAGYDDAGELTETTIRLLLEPLTRAERGERQAMVLKRAHEALAEIRAQADLSQPVSDEPTVERLGVAATEHVIEQLHRSLQATEDDIALIISRVHDWRGVHDENDEPVPFAADTLASLMKWDTFAKPVLDAFNACCEGAVPKNSQPGRAGARA